MFSPGPRQCKGLTCCYPNPCPSVPTPAKHGLALAVFGHWCTPIQGSLIFERNMSCHWLRIDDAPYVIWPATVGAFDLDVTFPFLQVGSRKTFHSNSLTRG